MGSRVVEGECGRVGGEETEIRIYCIKNFSIIEKLCLFIFIFISNAPT